VITIVHISNFKKKQKISQNLEWWYTLVIPALRRQREEDCEFEASLDYVRPCLKKKYPYLC
jgi:hypothetical protein